MRAWEMRRHLQASRPGPWEPGQGLFPGHPAAKMLLCICKRAHGIVRPRCHPATAVWEPPAQGSFSHGCWMGDDTPVHTPVHACVYTQLCAPRSLVGLHKRRVLAEGPASGPVGAGAQGRGACTRVYKPVRVCTGLHMDLHMGTQKSAHVSAAAVAGGDVHVHTRLHARRRAHACSTLIRTVCSTDSTLTAPGVFARTQAHGVHKWPFCLSMCAPGKLRQGGFGRGYPAPCIWALSPLSLVRCQGRRRAGRLGEGGPPGLCLISLILA